MALVKFNNTKNSASNYSAFNDLFDSLLKDSYVNDRALSRVPAVNIAEADHAFEIELAAPGLKKEDFKLNLEKNVLTISAEKKAETSEKDEKKIMARKEFSYSTFSRSFTLPEIADVNNITATYENGLLNVVIAKKEEAKAMSREISIS